jgi:hypothetical protein
VRWLGCFWGGLRETGVANPTFQNYSSFTSTIILPKEPTMNPGTQAKRMILGMSKSFIGLKDLHCREFIP